MKLTKRKGFNFYRSYYDVYNELTTTKEKIDFIEALLDRQFLGTKPTKLGGMAKFAYISQTNAIDAQVKGYEDKTGTTLRPPSEPPCLPPSVGESSTPCLQEEEKEEEKEKEQDVKKLGVDFDDSKLLSVFNDILGKSSRVIPPKAKAQLKARLKEGYSKVDFVKVITNAANDPFHIERRYKYLTLEFLTRPDKFERFLNMADFKVAIKRV